MNEPEPRITVSIERKLNLGNYESVGVGIIISSVPAGDPTETAKVVEDLLATGKIVYDKMRVRLGEKVAEERQKGANDDRRPRSS